MLLLVDKGFKLIKPTCMLIEQGLSLRFSFHLINTMPVLQNVSIPLECFSWIIFLPDWYHINFFAFHSSDFTSESYNAILLVRSFSKYFIEMLPNEDVIRHLGGSVVKSQSDEDVSGFSGQVLRCTGDDWCITYIYC